MNNDQPQRPSSRMILWLEGKLKTDVRYLLRGSFWLNFNVVINSALGLLIFIAFAHFIPKDTYGIYQYVLSLGGLVGAFTLTGMNPAITRAISRNNEGVLKESVIVQLKWAVIPFLISLCLGAYYIFHENYILGTAMFIMSVTVPITYITSSYVAFLYGKKDFKTFFIYNLSASLIYYIPLLVIIWLTQNVLYLIVGYFVTTMIGNIVAYFATIKKFQPNTQKDSETISYGKHLSLMGILGLIAYRIDGILMFQFTGPVELAVYSFAKVIPERIGGFFKSIGVIALPKYSQKTQKEIQSTIVRKTLQLLIAILLLCIAYALVAPTVFKIIFPNYLSSIAYSQVFIFTLISAAANLPLSALLSQKSQKKLYIYNTVNPLVNIAVLLLFIYYYGLWGAIIAKVISSFIGLFLSLALLFIPQTIDDKPSNMAA